MKAEKWLSCLAAAALAFGLSFGGCGCLASAFPLSPVNMAVLAECCGICAVAFALCFRFRLGAVPLCILALAGGYLWQRGTLALQTEALLNRISRIYDMAYGCGIVSWSGKDLDPVDLTVALCIIGVLVALPVTWTVCRRHRVWLAVPAALLPLIPCFVVTDTVPDEAYLFLLLLGLLLLVMTQTVRRQDPAQGNCLIGLLILPVALALVLLFLVVPREGYSGQSNAEKAMDAAVAWAQGLTAWGEEQPGEALGLEMDTSGLEEDKVNLNRIGPQTNLRYRVMTVTAAQTGPLYLRGTSFDTYDGETWTNSGSSGGEEALWPDSGVLEAVGQVTVETRSVHPVLYFPYYPDDMDWEQFTDGKLNNDRGLTTYTFTQMELREGYSVWHDADPLSSAAWEPFLALPDDTRAGAEKILAHIFPNGYSGQDVAAAIADYVRNSAAYDLKTQRMPADAQDFALWFLNESDTGYCVHFATATAVLLRAAGIPARYVTGYLASGVAGEPVVVSAGEAHAWVEYWLPDVGWVMLESTPAEDTREDPSATQTTASEASGQTESTQETAINPTGEQQPSGTSSPVPGATNPDVPPASPQLDLTWLRQVLKVLACVALALGLILAQWRLRLLVRRRKQRRGNANSQALARWREAEYLSRLLRQKPGDGLWDLAQKAKFSQHILTEEELARFDAGLEELRSQLRRKPLPLRVIYRLVFAAY